MTPDEREALAKLIVARQKANDKAGLATMMAMAGSLPPAELKDVTERVARAEATPDAERTTRS